MPAEPTVEETWRAVLTGQFPVLRRGRHLLGLIPSNQHCKNCHAPLDGTGALFMRLIGRGPYHKNPRFCSY